MVFRKIRLPSPTQINHAAPAQRSIALRDLPFEIGGRIAYLYQVVIEINGDDTFTNQPTREQLNSRLLTVTWQDGYRSWINGLSGNDLRFMEIFQSRGTVQTPDPDTDQPASTNNKYWDRIINVSDPRFEGDDFSIPCALLAAKNAQIVINPGALADIGADTTAATTDLNFYAIVGVRDELVIPAVHEWERIDFATSPLRVAGEAMYLDAMLFNGCAYDAIAAADFGEINVFTGADQPIQQVDAEGLTCCYYAEQTVSDDLRQIKGEVRAAADLRAKTLNSGASNTAPAVLDTLALCQPLFSSVNWGSESAHITQGYYCPSELKVTFGSLQAGTSRALFHRVVPVTPDEVADKARICAQKLGISNFATPYVKAKGGAGGYRGKLGKLLPHKFPFAGAK